VDFPRVFYHVVMQKWAFFCNFASLFGIARLNMKKFLKEYWLSIFVLLFMTIIVTCSTMGSILSKKDNTNNTIAAFADIQDSNVDAVEERGRINFDIPSPLENVPEQILYRKGYVVSYNKETRNPNWVAWHLTSNHTTGEFRRPGNAFHEDFDVPTPRANNNDYKGSGWSRGHMCPAGDNKWDPDAMYESFLLSNVCPQNANLNSGLWNQIEISCRIWAEKYGDIYIVCGPIFFNKEHETIGMSEVMVPEAFFKVVLCLNGEPKGIGFICRNTDGYKSRDMYVNSIKQVERITKMSFFPHLDQSVAEKVKNQSNMNDW